MTRSRPFGFRLPSILLTKRLVGHEPNLDLVLRREVLADDVHGCGALLYRSIAVLLAWRGSPPRQAASAWYLCRVPGCVGWPGAALSSAGASAGSLHLFLFFRLGPSTILAYRRLRARYAERRCVGRRARRPPIKVMMWEGDHLLANADAPTVIATRDNGGLGADDSADGAANGQQPVAAEQPERPPPRRRASLAPQTAPLIDGPPAPPRPRRASWPAPVPAPDECKEPSSTRSADLERFVRRRAETMRRATPDAQELEEQVRSAWTTWWLRNGGGPRRRLQPKRGRRWPRNYFDLDRRPMMMMPSSPPSCMVEA